MLAEACVLGKAIIASDIPTSKEILHNEVLGDCGAFFASGDQVSLAQSMQEIYSQESKRR